jgi:hypothetical protein
MKLNKKLREIAKIEEQVRTGTKVDRLQLDKLSTREKIEEQIAELQAYEALVRRQQEARLNCQTRAQQYQEQTFCPPHSLWAQLDQLYQEQMSCPPHPQWAYGQMDCAQAVAPSPQMQVVAPPSPQLQFVPLPPSSEPEQQSQVRAAGRRARRARQRQHGEGSANAPVAAREPATATPEDTFHVGGIADGRDEWQDMAKPLPNTEQQTFEAEEFGAIANDFHGSDKAAIARACAALRGNMMRATMHPIGCRAVQAMLEKADKEDKAELLGELHGNVKWAIWSPSGNYVIQKIVEVCPGNVWSFVVDELQGSEKSVARHRFGCRIWCRLMEHGDCQNPGLSALTDELIAAAGELSHHPFAHFAVHAILEHGTEDQRRRVGLALLGSLSHDANHRHCSRVIESALEHCPPDVQHALAEELMRTGAEGLASLARKRYGSFVVTALLQRAGESSMNVCNQLAAQATTLCHTKRGQRLLQDIGVQNTRMPFASLGA